jgi:prepilin-type N-terminal cleavage/methylation domain-containing protein
VTHAPTQRGFTLIEIIVSVAFSTIAVTMLKGTRNSTFENMALRIADTKLNELRSSGYAALPASGTFTSPELANLPQGEASTTVTVFNAKTKQVMTGVAWYGTDSRTHYISVSTLVTETGGL